MDRFEREIWPHAAAVLRTARIIARNDTEADDLAQETMLKAFRHLDQLVDPSGARQWLMTILRNTRLDRVRAESKHAKDVSFEQIEVDLPAADVSDDGLWGDPEATLNEFSDQQLIDALQQLPEEIRWTLLLVDVEGLEHADAAPILGVPVGTVKSRTHRGRSMLRKALEPIARQLNLSGRRRRSEG